MSERPPIPVLCINLDRDVDRWQSVFAQAVAHDQISLDRISGVPGRIFPDAVAHLLTGNEWSHQHKGTLGCFCGHVKAWEAVATSEAAFGLVIEDDVTLQNLDLLEGLALPADCDIAFCNDRTSYPQHTAGPAFRPMAPVPDFVLSHSYAVGGDGYFLSRSGAENLLRFIRTDRLFSHVDLRLLAYCLEFGTTGSHDSYGLRAIYPKDHRLSGYSFWPPIVAMQHNNSTRALEDEVRLRGDQRLRAARSFSLSTASSEMTGVHERLIIDIGMSEGNDSDFYLRKGFRVVGVEADSIAVNAMKDRFAAEIDAGRLVILNRAAWSKTGHKLSFWHNEGTQGHSSLNLWHGAGHKVEQTVESIAWPELQSVAGTPHYMKIDIEGGEVAFLESMLDFEALPTYISVECHTFDPISMLSKIGYRQFKLLNQTVLQAYPMPDPPMEGDCIAHPDWGHASGSFGRELPGARWLDFPEIARQFAMLRELREFGGIFQPWVWFDCHATL